MSDREKILNAIQSNKPDLKPIPEIHITNMAGREELIQDFIEKLTGIGGQVVQGNMDIVKKDFSDSVERGEWVVNTLSDFGKTNTEIKYTDRADLLAKVDRFYMSSTLGVAENGAVWIQEKQMMNRLLPFICQHLIVVLKKTDIVANMHEAYKLIQNTKAGFHVFIAGPSKTADIEQSLVIGAHGARSLKLFLID